MQRKEFYGLLQPIYPLLAQQFVDDYSLQTGKCIDLGTGPGSVGIEIAKITDMDIYFVDFNQEQLQLAQANYTFAGCDNQAYFIQADVHKLVFEDNFADFIISRGSLWFWKDPASALREIYRVLKPGGTALIGGGLGRYIPETMRKRLTEANKERLAKRGETRPSLEEFNLMVSKANLPEYTVINESGQGRWVEIRKTREAEQL